MNLYLIILLSINSLRYDAVQVSTDRFYGFNKIRLSSRWLVLVKSVTFTIKKYIFRSLEV